MKHMISVEVVPSTRFFYFLDAERSYRATQLAYRQMLGAYLIALGQIHQAVGTRSLP